MYAPRTYITIVLDVSGSMDAHPLRVLKDKDGYDRLETIPGSVSLSRTCEESIQGMIDQLIDTHKPEHGELFVRTILFGQGAEETMPWRPLMDLRGTNLPLKVNRKNQYLRGNTVATKGLWMAMDGVTSLNDGNGMDLEAASVVVYFTDGDDNRKGVSDTDMKERIVPLIESGQHTFVCLYTAAQKSDAARCMSNQVSRWGLDPNYCRVFETANAKGQWDHLTEQMLSYVDHRADGTITTEDLAES